MKLIKFLLPVTFLFCLSGCIEINEQIDVKANGSGQWVTRMDMGQLLDLMQNYLGKDEMEKQMPKRVMDTTIAFKSFTDTATNMSPEKKALVKDGKISMKLNMDEKIFNTEMYFPFKSLDNLQQLYTSLGDGSIGTGNLLKGLGGSKGDSSNPAAGNNNMQSPDMTQFNAIYDFKCKDGFISRKLNQEKLKALMENPQLSQMKDAGNMGVEIPYTITINLPRAVKKVDNPLAKVSDDKKTVIIKYNMIEMLNTPQKFEYSIEY
jgi:hypothetical protein